MSRSDFKDTRPLEELIEELYQRGRAEQEALDCEAAETGRRPGESLRLELAEVFKQAADPLAEVVEQAAFSFIKEARLAAGILAQVKLPERSTAGVEQWLAQLEERLASEEDADLRTLLKAALANFSRQLADPKNGSAEEKLVTCR